MKFHLNGAFITGSNERRFSYHVCLFVVLTRTQEFFNEDVYLRENLIDDWVISYWFDAIIEVKNDISKNEIY